MRIGVPRETSEGERRVALVPEVVQRLTRAAAEGEGSPNEVVIEQGAGGGALIPDQQYEEAGGRRAGDPGEV